MPFKVIGTNATGAHSFPVPTASDALKKYDELLKEGFQRITFKDDLGRTLTMDEIAVLSL